MRALLDVNVLLSIEHIQGCGQITDVYLLALAVKHGGHLVTFDTRIRREAVVGSAEEHLLRL